MDKWARMSSHWIIQWRIRWRIRWKYSGKYVRNTVEDTVENVDAWMGERMIKAKHPNTTAAATHKMSMTSAKMNSNSKTNIQNWAVAKILGHYEGVYFHKKYRCSTVVPPTHTHGPWSQLSMMVSTSALHR